MPELVLTSAYASGEVWHMSADSGICHGTCQAARNRRSRTDNFGVFGDIIGFSKLAVANQQGIGQADSSHEIDFARQ